MTNVTLTLTLRHALRVMILYEWAIIGGTYKTCCCSLPAFLIISVLTIIYQNIVVCTYFVKEAIVNPAFHRSIKVFDQKCCDI